ncbi:hypothetical protein RFI_06977 [Reticulomyxa filosa]|uniref:Uncharacterized protein n=1 Tax=Reticulomyxa filosa TaxID=46433 RepID=X6NVU3_RETFI|nr:hypothetical protein RFI_06977 [Reticulomyxa filosa]|eukprot:ETO30141.1 hypothetical protein RFI_06977 [Reticulomyxa filosa]
MARFFVIDDKQKNFLADENPFLKQFINVVRQRKELDQLCDSEDTKIEVMALNRIDYNIARDKTSEEEAKMMLNGKDKGKKAKTTHKQKDKCKCKEKIKRNGVQQNIILDIAYMQSQFFFSMAQGVRTSFKAAEICVLKSSHIAFSDIENVTERISNKYMIRLSYWIRTNQGHSLKDEGSQIKRENSEVGSEIKLICCKLESINYKEKVTLTYNIKKYVDCFIMFCTFLLSECY